MLLLVGLGNPGPGYARNRHNIGFTAVDAIARRYSLAPYRRRFHGLIAEGAVADRKVLALKPTTYVNDSGLAVAAAARFRKIPPSGIIVVHDDLDLAPGKVRVKRGGGHGGPAGGGRPVRANQPGPSTKRVTPTPRLSRWTCWLGQPEAPRRL